MTSKHRRGNALERVCVLAAAAALLAWPGRVGGAEAEPQPIVQKTRTPILLTVGPANTCRIERVEKDGRAVPAPPNMTLDTKAGTFSWTPTESQVGAYQITIVRRDAAGRETRSVRRITVQAREIVAGRGKLADLLRKWYREGTAAGNTGDFYDNRDSGHSRLNTGRFPQLDKVVYTDAQKKRRLHWALQFRFLFNHVTFGNSSTSASPAAGGSNGRRAVLSAQIAQVLYNQYTNSHLYIYPEHRDHDPGRNGRAGGYGDLFPANTPYVIISQGSSGSDRPFMQAVGYTLAAFRPEVKKLLIARGLLMPTVQMIFRSSNKNLKAPDDYLTGKAHPTAFEGKNVDPLKMAEMAHAMRRDAVPPMIQLAVLEEDLSLAGQDYFDLPRGERLFDTHCAVARVIRAARCVHRMVVSARASYDVNRRPLTYRWVVLRGDAARIQIKPLDKQASRVEIRVPYHERRPIHPGAPLESNRVDIGVFVHNGAHYSAPAFVSLTTLDDEARTYSSDGRILEIAYGVGDSTIGYRTDRFRARDNRYDITDFPAFLALLSDGKGGFPASLLRSRFAAAELGAFAQAAKELDAACEAEKGPKQQLDDAEAARKKIQPAINDAKKRLGEAKKAHSSKPTDATQATVAKAQAALKSLQDQDKKPDQQAKDAKKKLDEAQRAARGVLTRSRPALKGSVKDRLEKALDAIKDDPELYPKNAEPIEKLHQASNDGRRKRAFVNARGELVKAGILKPGGPGRFRISPVLPGPRPAAERLTKFERNRIEWFNIAVLQNIICPGLLNRRFQRNFVIAPLATPKTWRDVYHYDTKRHLIGWTRYGKTSRQDFTADGALVLKKDKLGRATEARTVTYRVEGDRRKPRGLKLRPGDTILHYEYASDADRVGRIAKREKARP